MNKRGNSSSPGVCILDRAPVRHLGLQGALGLIFVITKSQPWQIQRFATLPTCICTRTLPSLMPLHKCGTITLAYHSDVQRNARNRGGRGGGYIYVMATKKRKTLYKRKYPIKISHVLLTAFRGMD